MLRAVPSEVEGRTELLPIILLRTPYGTGTLNPTRVATALAHLLADGYIIVQQDIRGRFKSEGTFVMLRQPRDRADAKASRGQGPLEKASRGQGSLEKASRGQGPLEKAIDESTDTYDTIDWLVANVPGN